MADQPILKWVRHKGRNMSRATHWWLLQGEPARRLVCEHNIPLNEPCGKCADGG